MRKLYTLLASAAITFALIPSVAVAQLTEGFETDPPTGWFFTEVDAADPGFIQSAARANSGTFSRLKSDDNLAAATNAWMVSPSYVCGANDELKFWFNHDFYGFYDNSSVYISTASNDPITNPGDFALLQNLDDGTTGVTSEDTWNEIVINLAAYNGSTIHIAFRYTGDFAHRLYVDDFSLDAVPACAAPSDLAAGSITTTSASLSWTENGTATMWDVEHGATGFTPTGAPSAGYNDIANPVSLTGLTANTTYDYYVRADCGGTQSSWVGPFTFTTLCNAFSGTYTEGFETDPPACWQFFEVDAADPGFIQSAARANSGSFSRVKLDDNLAAATNAWMVSPGFTCAATDELKFWFNHDFYGFYDNSSYYISTAGDNPITNPGDFTLISELDDGSTGVTSEDTWNEIVLDLTAYSGQTIYVAFRYTGDFAHRLYIDDFSLAPQPACPDPSDLAAGSITTSSASLSWTENGTATMWDVEHGATGFTPTGVPSAGFNDIANPVSLTGLTDNTTYDYYVRADCGGSQSNWIGPFTFTTACNAFSGTYTEGFETYPPACWQFFEVDPLDPGFIHTAARANSGGFSIFHNDDNLAAATTSWAVSPGFTCAANDELKFWFNHDFYGFYDNSSYYISTASDDPITNPGDFTLISELDDGTTGVTSEDTWNEIVFNLAAYNGATIYVAFAYTGDFAHRLYIDDFSLAPVPPCADPSDLTATSITTSSASLGWTENGTATMWDVEHGATGFTPAGVPSAGFNDIANPVSLTGLTDNTTYDYYVRADCGGTQSNWIGPFTFTTLCNPLSGTYTEGFETYPPTCWQFFEVDPLDPGFIQSGARANSGSFSMLHSDDNLAAATTAWAVSPGFTCGANDELKFWFNHDFYGFYDNSSYYISAASDNPITNPGDFTLISELDDGSTGVTSEDTWNEIIFNLAAYNGATIYVAFAYTGDFAHRLYIDDFSLAPAPACADPSMLAAGSLTTSSASVSWQENGTATMWDVEYGATGFTPAGTPSAGYNDITNPVTITGLTDNTSYDYYVRADCGGAQSAWVGPFTFTTLCNPFSGTYTEGFETYPPACWQFFEVDPLDPGFIQSGARANSGSFSMLHNDDNLAAATTAWAVSPGFTCAANDELRFFFNHDFYGFYDNSSVYISTASDDPITNPGDFALLTELDDGSTGVTSEDTWNELVFNLAAYSTQTIYVAFAYTGDFAHRLYIDDFSIAPVPPCPDPSDLTATSITTTTADLGWTENGTATMWDVELGTAGFLPTGTPSVGYDDITNPVTATGLTANTAYEYFVRADCGGAQSNWIGPFAFQTLCNPFSGTYTEPFETSPLACWQFFEVDPLDPGFVQTGARANGGSTSYYHNDDNLAAATTAWMVSPGFTCGTNDELKFWFNHNFYGFYDNSSVWISSASDNPITNPGDFTQLTELDDGSTGVTSEDTWNEQIFNLAAYNGSTIYIAFGYTGDFAHELYIDDFSLAPAPACPDPSDQTATSITTTTADLGLTENGSATMWDIEIGTCGFLPTGTPTAGYNDVTNPFTATGLTQNTCYEWYVRSDCGGAQSNWIGPHTFTTACAAVSSPYVEPFETDPLACWSFMETLGADPGFIRTALRANTGGFSYYHNDDNLPSAGTAWMISPPYTAGANDEVKFWFNHNFYGFYDNSSVWVSAASADPINNPGDFTLLSELDDGTTGVTSEDTWNQLTFNLAAYSGQTIYIAFAYTGDFAHELYIDDLGIDIVPPCPDPQDLVLAGAGSTTADIGWTANSAATNYNFEIGPTGFTPDQSIDQTGTSNPATLTGLTGNTTYDVYLQDNCEATSPGDGTSNWIGPLTFTTAQGCGTNFYDSGGSGGNYSNGEDIVTTICGTPSVDWAQVDFTAFEVEDNWDVLLVYNGNSTSATQISSGNGATIGGFPAGGYWGTDIPGPFISTDASSCLTFRFLSDGFANEAGWEAAVTCVTCLPINEADGSVDAVTPTTANISWTCPHCIGGDFYVEWGEAGSFTPGTGVGSGGGTVVYTAATTSAAFTGLTPSTQYVAYVRDNCGAGDFSANTPIFFTTPPANDDCANAHTLTVGVVGGYCTTGETTSNIGATTSGVANPSCYSAADPADVWYDFVAPPSGEVVVETSPSTGSGTSLTDCVMSVYDACAGTEIGCDDDSGPGLMPSVHLTGLTPGNTYIVRVWDYNSNDEGEFDICVTDPSDANNDDICDAFPVNVQETCNHTTYTNNGATLDAIPAGCSSMIADVWFTVTAPADGEVILSTITGTVTPVTDMVMEAFTSTTDCSGTLTSVGCNDDGGVGTMPFLELTGLTPGETIYVRIADYAGNGTDFGTFQFAAFPAHIWTGATSSAFTTASNWCSQITPGATDDVMIEANPTNPMVISSNQSVGGFQGDWNSTSLDVQAGNTLSVSGDMAISGANIDGTIEMDGTAPQTLTLGLGCTMNNLHINNSGGGVTFNNGSGTGITITGELGLEQGHLTPNGPIVIASTPAGDGWVNDFDAGYTGTVGDITVQRYMDDSNYHLISSPISNPDIPTQLSEYVPNGPNGVAVTPTALCNADSLAANSVWGRIMEFREPGPYPTGCYQEGYYVRSSGTMENGRGYSANHNPYASPWTLSITGPVNTGTVSYGPLTNTGGAPALAQGYHMLGNPFASVYRWNANTGTSGIGGFASVYMETGLYSGTYSNVPPFTQMASYQAWIANWNGTGTGMFTPGPGDRIAAGNVPFLREANDGIWGDYTVQLDVTDGTHNHWTRVYFSNEGWAPGDILTTAYDNCCDGPMIPGSTQPYLYTSVNEAPYPPGNNWLQTNGLPPLTESYSVPMGFMPGNGGSMTITASDLATLPAGFVVELEDTHLNVTQVLTDNPSYSFSATAGDAEGRFILHFHPSAVTTIADEQALRGEIYNQFNDIVVRLNTQEDFDGRIEVYDMLGNMVLSTGNVRITQGSHVVDASSLTTGIYIAKLFGDDYSTENKVFIR